MNVFLSNLLKQYSIGEDGIYDGLKDESGVEDQVDELVLRNKIAQEQSADYLGTIAKSHSIEVMDREVEHFLKKIPDNGAVLDIGGCWGWHWRRLSKIRPDISVLIIDFARSNLTHARVLLEDQIGHQVALMHANAVALPFEEGNSQQGFDGVWTVQTYQHIPNFRQAVQEAHRVLKSQGYFANYSLNCQFPVKLLYRILGRHYPDCETLENRYYLARASKIQIACIEEVFGAKVKRRWSEFLFNPQLHMTRSGKVDTVTGRLDACLSNKMQLFGMFAHQQSFHCTKQS